MGSQRYNLKNRETGPAPLGKQSLPQTLASSYNEEPLYTLVTLGNKQVLLVSHFYLCKYVKWVRRLYVNHLFQPINQNVNLINRGTSGCLLYRCLKSHEICFTKKDNKIIYILHGIFFLLKGNNFYLLTQCSHTVMNRTQK